VMHSITKYLYLWVLGSISPACTDTPALEAPIDRLTYFRVVGASVTVTRKGAILIVIVTGVAECDTTLCSAAVSLRSWPCDKNRLALLSKTNCLIH
jgi:hypothetical protein